jgi:plasmid maintenance system antidote protein VapI/DNA-binding XRE family transcriptional regulator
MSFDPDWVISPGETLRDWIDENGLTVRSTATVCGRMPVERLARILDGKQPITRKDAAALAHGTGIPAQLWLNLERQFREGLAARRVWVRGVAGGLLPHLGRAVREARREAGCTLAQVAAELGVHESTPSRFENGVAWPANPDAAINAYSRATGVSVADLWLRAVEAWDEAVADAAR